MNPHNSSADTTVEIIHRRNRIKEKIADDPQNLSTVGFIDPAAIARADSLIENSGQAYQKELDDSLASLATLWQQARAEHGSSGAKECLDNIHRTANFIKDIASTYHYDLMAYFAESLRDFIDTIDLNNAAHDTIIDAHFKTMKIAGQHGLRDENSPQAQELKKIVALAITKHKNPHP